MCTLQTIWPDTPHQYAQIVVAGLTANSRQVQQGHVFIALQGRQHDARRFIPQAIAQGAVAILCQSDEPLTEQAGIPIINIADLPQRLGEIAARFYGQPSQDLTVFAVTGTNGKTSCAQLLAHACQFLE